VSHGNSKGLRLGGTLLLRPPRRARLGQSRQDFIYDSGVLTGFDVQGATSLQGTIFTASQPSIRSPGTLDSTLTSDSDFVINSTNLLRLSADATACNVQAGDATTANAASDIFIGNDATTIAGSIRKPQEREICTRVRAEQFSLRQISYSGCQQASCSTLAVGGLLCN